MSAALLTVHEVAQYLRVDETTVRRWVKLGALPAIPLPSRRNSKRVTYRIQQTTLDHLLHTSLSESALSPVV